MIKIFDATDTDFSSNGDIVVKPYIARVHKEDNSDYYLELECPLDYEPYIYKERIIVANTPQGDQPFRVADVNVTKNKVSAKCWHVFYDLKNVVYSRGNYRKSNTTCLNALREALTRAHGNIPRYNGEVIPYEFKGQISSDILTQMDYQYSFESVYDCIMGIVEKWGGHLVRDGFDIAINGQIGQDNGILVQYGSNIKEITCDTNWDEVSLEILPVGKDSTILTTASGDFYAPFALWFSPFGVQHSCPMTQVVKFEQDIDRENYSTDAEYQQALENDLYIQAIRYLMTHREPNVNYTLKIINDRIIDIGDIIEVRDSRLHIHVTTRVISYDFDCISEKYTDVQFSNFQKSISGLGSIVNKIEQNQRQAVVGIGKQLIFNTDGTVKWIQAN